LAREADERAVVCKPAEKSGSRTAGIGIEIRPVSTGPWGKELATMIIALVVIALLSLGAVIVCAARPTRTILPLYAGMVPVGSVVTLPLPLPAPFNTLSSVLGAVVIIAGATHVIFYRRGRVPTLPVGVWIAFLAWATLTIFWAMEWRTAFNLSLIATSLILLMVIVAVLPADEVDLDILRVALIIGGAVVGVYALVLVLSGSPLPVHGVGERFSLAQQQEDTNPNQLAATLLLPMILSIDRIIEGGTRWWRPGAWRVLGAVGAVTSICAIVLSGSRGGVLAAIIAFGLTPLYWWIRRPDARAGVRRLLVGTVCFVLVLFTTVTIAVWISPDGRVADILSSDPIDRLTHSETGTSGRSEIWSTGYLACRSHCAWGAGFDNFPILYSEIFPFSAAARNVGLERPAHNVYLELAVETGVVGVTLFVLALIAEFATLRTEPMKRIAPSLTVAILVLLFANVFEGQIWFKYFWIVFVLIRVSEASVYASRKTLMPLQAPPAS
jgi:O-antigen ligase